MSGSLTRGCGENVPGIPGACATRNFTHLVRDPLLPGEARKKSWMTSTGYGFHATFFVRFMKMFISILKSAVLNAKQSFSRHLDFVAEIKKFILARAFDAWCKWSPTEIVRWMLSGVLEFNCRTMCLHFRQSNAAIRQLWLAHRNQARNRLHCEADRNS